MDSREDLEIQKAQLEEILRLSKEADEEMKVVLLKYAVLLDLKDDTLGELKELAEKFDFVQLSQLCHVLRDVVRQLMKMVSAVTSEK